MRREPAPRSHRPNRPTLGPNRDGNRPASRPRHHDLKQPKPEPTFGSERELNQHFAVNLHLIEPGLRLYESGGLTGYQFPIQIAEAWTWPTIDILAVDRDDNLVVIECKLGKGNPAAVGQLVGYISWVRENLARGTQTVRGILLCDSPAILLWHALRELRHLPIKVYQFEGRRYVFQIQHPTTRGP